jgi:hypothetical protein
MIHINRDQWLAAIKDATEQPLPPSDALTVKEFCALLEVNRFTATQRLQRLLALKKIEKTVKLIRRTDGVVIRATAYRLIQEPADVRPRTPNPRRR